MNANTKYGDAETAHARARTAFSTLSVVLAWLIVAGSAFAADSVVVTTTLIETAARALLGDEVEIVRLMPPGSCPGHFDLEPRQVTALGGARLFVRHDYQAALDAGAQRGGLDPAHIAAVTSYPSFVIPSNYARMCKELADIFARAWPERAGRIRERARAVDARAERVERQTLERAAPLRNRRILAATYQQAFCAWLGLDVVAVFQAGTDESARQLALALDQARLARAESIAGNAPWGPRHLEALTEALDLPGAVLGNFPSSGEPEAYWQLVEENTDALLRARP